MQYLAFVIFLNAVSKRKCIFTKWQFGKKEFNLLKRKSLVVVTPSGGSRLATHRGNTGHSGRTWQPPMSPAQRWAGERGGEDGEVFEEVERVGAEDQCEGLDSFTQETLGGRQNSGLRKRLMFENPTVCRCTLIVGGWFRWGPLTHVGMHADCLKALSSAHYPGPEEDPTHFSSVYRTSDLWNLDPAHVPGTRQNPAKISSPFSLREVYRCKKAL